MEKEVETSLFSLPPELLCGISCYLPGEELRQFGTTCTRLKTIADRTAVGRIAYLLRKSEPLWARLHRGAIRHGMRSPTAILEFMEVQMRLAHTKNTDPIIVTLDTGNPDHSVDSVDHLEDVNLFDSPKFPAQIRIEKDLAAAAFFNRLPKLTVYTWNLAAEPTKSPSSSEIGPIWRRPPTRTVALDLSNFDIFDDDIPILGDVQICAKFVAVYLGCIGVVVVVDMQRDRDVSVKVHRTSQSILNFRGFFVENETHFFAFEEADDWIDEFTPAFLTFYSAKDGRQLEEYLKIDELLSSPHGIKRLNDKVFVVSEKRRNFFHVVTLDKESPVARHFAFRHEIEFATKNCIFKLEEVCGRIFAICCCRDHVCSYDLLSRSDPFSSYRLLAESDTTKFENLQLKLPAEGIDFAVQPTKRSEQFFRSDFGNWYRVWFEREKCRFKPNAGIRIPKEIDDQNATFYPTMIHSRSQCSVLYEYMPAPVLPKTQARSTSARKCLTKQAY